MEVIIGSIITALITGGLSLIGVIHTSKRQHDITISEMQRQNDLSMQNLKEEHAVSFEKISGEIRLIQNDIKNLEIKQDKHNGLIDRMFQVEKAIEVIDERQKTANHRISDLEQVKGE